MAFEAIASGALPHCSHVTISALLKAGLIEKIGNRTIGRDVFGMIRVPVYEVPLLVHAQWCQWCSENVSDDA